MSAAHDDASARETERLSRLMALERLGIVSDYGRIRGKSVAVVGIGGVGSVAAEMLVRCHVGKLIFFDYDDVEVANMNRLFYRPKHVGLSKTEAARRVLSDINPSVQLQPENTDVASVGSYAAVLDILRTGGLSASTPVDLILGCVDNYQARLAVDRMATELGLPWIESGVSENGVAGHIQLVLPGQTACFHCAPPMIVASGVDESTLKRDGVCAASLPTTMAIVAGLLVQNALKFLLDFGDLTYYQGYSALNDHFPNYVMKPNPHCSNRFCVDRQRLCAAAGPTYVRRPPAPAPAPPPDRDDVWHIELVAAESADNDDKAAEAAAAAAPSSTGSTAQSLDDLRCALDSLCS